MDIRKVDKNLKKINSLYATIKDEVDISPIEVDLLKSYVRNLYEGLIETVPNPVSARPTESNTDRGHASTPTDYKLDDEAEPDPVRTLQPTSPPTVESIVRKELHTTPPMQATPLADQKPVTVSASISRQEVVEPTPEPIQKPRIKKELQSIFAPVSINELSDRLSNAPIQDLTRQGFSINDRILNISELFGGDATYYQTVLERLNTFSTYEEAQQYLAGGVALDKDWAAEDKMQKATNFVRVVQRRYMN